MSIDHVCRCESVFDHPRVLDDLKCLVHIFSVSHVFAESEIKKMASMTIRNLSDDIKQRLRLRAAEHGHSMEEEARAILRAALTEQVPHTNLARAIHDRFASLGGVELDIPPREPMCDPSRFG